MAFGYANLYFQDFGTYADFGMPQGSVITKVRIKVTGKTSYAYYVGLSLQKPATSNCQFPSDLWTGYLGGDVINVQDFTTNVIQDWTSAVSASCLSSYNLENNMTWRINYSSSPAWSANIDNFEIAFDYDPGPTPTPTTVPTATPSPTPTLTPISKTPLILIPGIAGSELKTVDPFIWYEDNGHGGTYLSSYDAGEKIWINTFQAKLPGDDDYFDVLRMNHDGQTGQVKLELTKTLYGGYDSAIKFFTDNGYDLGKTLFLLPYDWRLDIANSVTKLTDLISSIKTNTGSTKVDIIAHSMGGLVARNYISDPTRAQNVRKLFTLGTPHLGAVEFLKRLRFGGCLTKDFWDDLARDHGICVGVSPSEVKDIIQNMISGYELAPSQEYFNFYGGRNNSHPNPYQNEGQLMNYDQIKSFLTSLGYNTGLFGPSETFHSLDNKLTDTNGVEITNIVGSGLETIGQIREYKGKDFLGNIIQKKDGFSVNGDKTVPLFSASLDDKSRNLSLLGNAKVFYTNQNHGDLATLGPALNLVKNILDNNSQLPSGILSQPYSFNGTQIAVYSPVNIDAYDSLGRHTGLTPEGDYEENIPGSSYDALDDAKFIFLPEDGVYNIEFKATDKGSFDFKIRKYNNDTISQETLYKDIPLTSSTSAVAQLDTSSSQSPTIHLDENGNGIIQDINPSSILIGNAISDQIPPKTDIQVSGLLGNNGWYRSDVIVSLIPEDNLGGAGILKTEYSLDNGQTVNAYTGPFIISAEKVNKLKFRSIDNAGNEEDPQEMDVKIDKTAPEVKISVDPDKQDLTVFGVDANPTTVIKSDNKFTKKKNDAFYMITDLAGNSLKLDVRERDNEKQDRFKIYSLQYNDGPIKILADNYFNITYNGKRQKQNVKEQNFESRGIVRIRIQYDAKKNKSTIIIREDRKERIKEIRNGLVYLNLLTDKGQLRTSY
jgi:pimeloyl-ACP methyl ester carboxylesterase